MAASRSLALAALALALSGWTTALSGCDTTIPLHPEVPQRTDDGWETAPLSQVAIDDAPIGVLLREIANGEYHNVNGVVLVRNGKLVLEAYFPGQDQTGRRHTFDRDTLHEQHSVTKSVTSILVGIAIDQRGIVGPEATLSTFFPENAALISDSIKRRLTIADFLTMRAGLAWNEWKTPYTDSNNVLIAMYRSRDPVRHILDLPVADKPGTVFTYNGGLSITLGEVIHRASGLRADAFADRFLFGPLGITTWSWERFEDSTVNAGGGLRLRPRDMAKIGQLMLNGGRWHGANVVSESWVRESTRRRVDDHPPTFPWYMRPGIGIARRVGWLGRTPDGYGYHWWHRSFRVGNRILPAFSAEGRGGQFIVVVPDIALVAVFTGWNDNIRAPSPIRMLDHRILPAIRVH